MRLKSCLRTAQFVKKDFDKLLDGGASSPPQPPLPVFAEIFQISGRKNCKETIFALENGIFRRKNPPVPTVHAAGHDGNSRGLWPSRALQGFFDSLSCLRAAFLFFGEKNSHLVDARGSPFWYAGI